MILSKIKKLYYLSLAILGMGAFYPFVHNYIFFGDYKTIVSLLIIFLWCISLILTKKKFLIPDSTFNIIIIIQCIFLFLHSIIQEDIFLGLLNLGLSWVIIFLIINSIPVEFFLKNFIRINILSAVFCVLGTIGLAYGLIKIYGVYEYQDDFKIFNFGWFFVKDNKQFINEIRPAGYYDEPGSFAYVVMFLLLLNRKYFKNITWEYLLLFLPLVTTSLAHFITMLLFVVIYYLNPQNVLKFTLFLVLFASTSYVIFSGTLGNEKSAFFKRKFVDRIENVIEGEDKSRQGGFELGPEIFRKHHWGYSLEKVKKEYPDFVNETIWGPLIYFGILGFPFYFLPFLVVFTKSVMNRDKMTLLMLLLVLINLIQRPSYIYPLFVVLLYFLFFHQNTYLKTVRLG